MENQTIYNYCNDFSKIITLDELKTCIFINSLCITTTINDAAIKAGVSKRTLESFIKNNNITHDDIIVLRNTYKSSNLSNGQA